jgi:3-hydroxyisobutyrate dehydrogenase
MRVGVAGLGHMGSRIAEKLVEAGHEVVVWDRNEDVARTFGGKGARPAASPAELGSQVEVVMASLADDEAVRSVVLDQGLVASMTAGGALIDLSTVSPETSRELAERAREQGVEFLDVAVSGSIPQVEAGEVVLLVGGDEGTLERCRPLLEPIAKAILHMGANGSGTSTKLAVNLLLGVGMQALAEAIALGEAQGLERKRLLDALGQTAVVAPAHKPKLDNARTNEYPVAFARRLMHKDFDLLLEEARRRDLELPAAAAAARICAAEHAAASEDEDFSAVIRQMEERLKRAATHS